LRSDGLLYKLENWAAEPRVTTLTLGIPTQDNEGLSFDPGTGRLLIAPKSRWLEGPAGKDRRPVFAFELAENLLLGNAVFVYSVDAIRDFADAQDLELPERRKKKGKGRKSALRFMPASIAVHPLTSEVFVLSAVDRVLASFDRRGKVTGYALLDDKLFRQPEGIAFLPNGDMVVTNEGDGKKATLLRFHMQRERR